MKYTAYLSLETTLAIHDTMIEQFGGSHGIRDIGLLYAALARPQASFNGKDLYPTLFDKAGALFHSLMFNHPFVDGNKRTTITATARFLAINGYELTATPEEFVTFPLDVENNHRSPETIAMWLKAHTGKSSK